MPYLEWNDDLLTGIQEIDSQHKMIFEYANELHEHLVMGEGNTLIDSAIAKVVDYAKIHFRAEEHYMKERGYPALAEHQDEHKLFVDKVALFTTRARSNKPLLARDILLFLGSWYTNHISVTDGAFAAYMMKHYRVDLSGGDGKDQT